MKGEGGSWCLAEEDGEEEGGARGPVTIAGGS
jgi:hypothetical protein